MGLIIFLIVIVLLFNALGMAIAFAFLKSAIKVGVQQALWETLPKICHENQAPPMPPQNFMPPQQGFYNMPPR